MGIKERRTKLLLLIFLLGDIPETEVELKKDLLDVFDVPLNQKTKSSFKSLVREELLTQNADDESKYTLTPSGIAELSLSFPYVRFLFSSWDGVWRILSYEIPETKRDLRDRFRREMAGWGWGPWHRSFWITPHPVMVALKDLVQNREEKRYLQAFEGSHILGEREILTEKVWNLKSLEKKYRELFKLWHMTLSKDEDKKSKLKEITKSYIEVLKIDPGLPKEIIGVDWIGFESFTIFKEIRSILLT